MDHVAVWFTLMKTEISINRKILIPLTEMESEKFETETDKFGYTRFVSIVLPVHIINTVCNVAW